MNLGGTEKALLSLIKTLGEESANITLLLLEKGGVLETQILDFVNVKYLEDFDKMKPIIENPPLQTLIALIASFKMFSAFTFLLTYCKIKISGNWYHNYKAALVNTPNFGSYDIAVAFAGPSDFISYFVINKVTAKKKIQWIHFDIEKIITNYNFGRKYYPFFDQIICVSEGAKKIFLKNFPQFENRTYVFYNIVIPAEIKKMAVEGDSFNDKYNGIKILTVGRFSKEKGQYLIPAAVVELKKVNIPFRWYLIGDGKEKENIQNRVKELNIEDDIIFLGAVNNPYKYMQDCDIYVQTSVHEGFGITVEEVKVFNKPIVVTNFASAMDLLEHEKTGLIVDITSDGIYKALVRLFLSTDLKIIFSQNLAKRPLLSNCEVDRIFNL